MDLGPPNGGFVFIDEIDLAPNRRALYYSVNTDVPFGSVWRIVLPDGRPERVAAGVGPAVSRDGQRLAFVAGHVLHIRDLISGEERTFPDAVGELGGSDTDWSQDDRHVTFASHAADGIGGTGSIDLEDGATVDLKPTTPDLHPDPNYRVSEPSTGDALSERNRWRGRPYRGPGRHRLR